MKFANVVRGTVIAALLLPMLPAAAQIKSKHSESAEATRAEKVGELPNCARRPARSERSRSPSLKRAGGAISG